VDSALVGAPSRVSTVRHRRRLAGEPADRAYWTLVDVGPDVLAAAETLVAVHPLRTLDAVPLASAQLFAGRVTTPELIFVSADARQVAAAAAVGVSIEHIGS
jgi:hypothetical protein